MEHYYTKGWSPPNIKPWIGGQKVNFSCRDTWWSSSYCCKRYGCLVTSNVCFRSNGMFSPAKVYEDWWFPMISEKYLMLFPSCMLWRLVRPRYTKLMWKRSTFLKKLVKIPPASFWLKWILPWLKNYHQGKKYLFRL